MINDKWLTEMARGHININKPRWHYLYHRWIYWPPALATYKQIQFPLLSGGHKSTISCCYCRVQSHLLAHHISDTNTKRIWEIRPCSLMFTMFSLLSNMPEQQLLSLLSNLALRCLNNLFLAIAVGIAEALNCYWHE